MVAIEILQSCHDVEGLNFMHGESAKAFTFAPLLSCFGRELGVLNRELVVRLDANSYVLH